MVSLKWIKFLINCRWICILDVSMEINRNYVKCLMLQMVNHQSKSTRILRVIAQCGTFPSSHFSCEWRNRMEWANWTRSCERRDTNNSHVDVPFMVRLSPPYHYICHTSCRCCCCDHDDGKDDDSETHTHTCNTTFEWLISRLNSVAMVSQFSSCFSSDFSSVRMERTINPNNLLCCWSCGGAAKEAFNWIYALISTQTR